MSKYRPATLPKGNSESRPDEAIPPVRTRAEIRKEWEERQRAERAASREAVAKSTEPADGPDTVAAAETASVPVASASAAASVPSPAAAPAGAAAAVAEPESDVHETAKETGVPEAAEAAPRAAEPQAAPVETGPEAPLDDGTGDRHLDLTAEDEGLVSLPPNRNEHGFVPMPTFSEPTTEDPRERLEHYARGVVAAEYASRANVQRAKQQKIIVQGQYLLAMKREQLWHVLGLPGFDALVKQRFNYGKNYANKIIRAMPVVKALESVTSMELAEKHLRPLAPVQEKHGDEAVRATWDEALRKGKITEKSLREAAYFLGYGEPVEQKANVVGGRRREGSTVSSPRIRTVEEAFGEIRSLMQTDSAQARKEALKLWKLAEQLREELGIEVRPESLED
ncbi:hypothetical protein [Streptomyces sp. NPDC003077]|uniref:hypothetical protein n=1 Tax=Streptomyces sp. NPDC003077 TaxID=3154443 RepID=UPI0033ABBAAD